MINTARIGRRSASAWPSSVAVAASHTADAGGASDDADALVTSGFRAAYVVAAATMVASAALGLAAAGAAPRGSAARRATADAAR